MAAAITQSPHFFNLCTEIQAQILGEVLEDSNSLDCRTVCKTFLTSSDKAIKKKWEDLQKNPPPGPFGFIEACTRVNKKYAKDGFNYLTLFRALNQEWGIIGVKIHDCQLNVSSSYQAELQNFLCARLNDFSLEQIWNRTMVKFYQFGWSKSGAAAIRNFFSLLRTQHVLSTFERMDFSDLDIRYIPIEVSYFTGLRALRLCRNNIDILPNFIGNLKELRVLDLSDNDLQVLPKDFPNWTHLRRINLDDNPLNSHGLRQCAEWKANVAALRQIIPMELD